MYYYFSVFKYDVKQKTLHHEDEIIDIPKKCHELLLYLLENPNQLITRDELIDHVWHGRVVTHNTIDQSILKLRKALSHILNDDYIESVYGQGIRFLPNIETHSESSIDPKSDEKKAFQPNHSSRLQWLFLASIVFMTWLFLLYQNNQNSEQIFDPSNSKLDITGINKLTTTADDNSWLIKGGQYYLKHLIAQAPNTVVHKTTVKDTPKTQLPQLMIEVTNHTLPQDFALISINQNTESKSNSAYSAYLQSLKAGQITRETVIHANQLTLLFPAVADWITDSEVTKAKTQHKNTEIYTTDEFALYSYLQATYQQAKGNSAQALVFLEAAVEQDPSFKTAWYEMAIALRKQSDPRKALGILNAIITDEPNLAYRVALVKAQCLDALGEYAAAAENYQKTLALAQKLNQTSQLAAVYISQGILYRKTKQFKAAEKVLEQAASLVDVDTEPQLFGTIMNTHAKLAREMNQPEVAIEKAKSAIIAFQKSGDRRYQMQAKTVLASILRLRNEFKSAEQLVKESLFHAEQLNNRRGISDNRTKLARLYQQTGRFRLAFEQWQMVLSLNAELELFTNSADAYLWLINLHLTENNVSQAEIDLKILTQLYHEQPIAPINPILIEAQLIVSLFKEDLESSQSYLSALIGTDHDLINMYQGDVALLRGNSMAAELHYLEALIGINPMARFDQMVQVLNKLNALYASTQSPKLNANIQRTLRLKPFIYPIQKFQALSAQAADNPIKALSLMEELKLKAGDYWQYQDQILLESMQSP